MNAFRFAGILALLALAACADDPTGAPPPAPEPDAPQVLGVYEVTLTGVGTPNVQASAAPVPAGPDFTLTPQTGSLALEVLSSSSFTEGARGQGGQRYINVTYRVRNATGAPVSNVTMVPVTKSTTIPGTPFSSLVLFNGTAADPSLASQFVPTGAVTLGGGTAMRATEVDVLQVFQESEVAAMTPPAGVTGVFPYGFVVRNATSAASRTLPAASGANDYAGLVTFAFRYPLTASANQDPFLVSFQIMAVVDTETRMTESMEEGQDTSAVRRVRERAAALGATTVTVLPGSPAAGPDVPDYPGQRQICGVRTAGTAAAPVRYVNSPAAYAVINLLRPGESLSACGASFRSGTPTVVGNGYTNTFTLVAMDRYGNVRTSEADSVQLERVSGLTPGVGARTALAGGQAAVQVTYPILGTSVLRAVGRRVRTEHAVDVGSPTVVLYAGDKQSTFAGMTLATAPAVLVRDAGGNPLPGRTVTFSVTGGGGAVTGATAVTNASGIARPSAWVTGTTPDLNTLTATVAGTGVTGSPVAFSASGCTGPEIAVEYAITLCFTSPMTPAQRAVFQNAVNRWQGLVTADLPPIIVSQPAGFCGTGSYGLNMEVDDLLIFAGIEAIDGTGGTLGSAGPCWIRNTGSLSIVGVMRFDAADVASLEAGGSFGSVILHEMGHVLGIGTLWSYFGLLKNPSPAGSPLDTYYAGTNGVTGFNAIGGSAYTGGQKVPVENTGGSGTRNAHWRESVLANELMTGYLNTGSNPLSQLTVRSLADMGYAVNVAAADPLFLTLALRGGDALAEPGLQMLNDVWQGPIRRVDGQGRVTSP